MNNLAIRVESLSKKYLLGNVTSDTLRDQLSHTLKRFVGRQNHLPKQETNSIWALKDISFEVKEGEVLGIIGKNGAGKSTLLKLLSRITHPTSGHIEVYGRVASLLEVGTGFHPELTGRENIYLNAAILGMKRHEIRSKFDEIVAFAEIDKFIDTPVKRYSSGMYMRLAFAVAAHLEPDILIIDEVLAVGDSAFQKKSLGKMDEVSKSGRTVLFVSHNMATIRSLCTRSVWLDYGEIKMIGKTSDIVDRYLGLGEDQYEVSLEFPEETDRRIQIQRAFIQTTPENNTSLKLIFDYSVHKSVDADVFLAVQIRNSQDIPVYYANDEILQNPKKRQIGHHRVILDIPIEFLAPGSYFVAFGFWQPGHSPEHFPEERLIFHREMIINKLTSHGILWPSLLYLPSKWEYVERF